MKGIKHSDVRLPSAVIGEPVSLVLSLRPLSLSPSDRPPPGEVIGDVAEDVLGKGVWSTEVTICRIDDGLKTP